MKKTFFLTVLAFGILSFPLMFSFCRHSSNKQQIEIVTPSTYGEWEDWCKVNVYLQSGESWHWIEGDEGRYKVQRRIVNGEKEYRISFSKEWFPVTETVANVKFGETKHYRFSAFGSTYYFNM